VIRKSQAAIALAQKKLRRRASKTGTELLRGQDSPKQGNIERIFRIK
jgi:hypothetical protein